MTKLYYFLIAFLLFCGQLSAQSLETVNYNGQNHTMLVYAPAGLTENRPLVISLHGANQDAEYQKNQTNWNNCADSAKFVVVYPNALSNKFWDTGGDSDLKFIEHVMDLMYDRYKIDRNRIYLSGFSLGAMMTYVCMDKLADKVAAFAPVSGVRFDKTIPTFSRHVPFIHTHGTGDDTFKWLGDPEHPAGGYPYIPDYVENCAKKMGLTTSTTIKPYPETKANSNAWLVKHTKAGDPIEVWLLALNGKGHWHSEDISGGVSTTQEIWKFFKKYALAPPIEPEYEENSFDIPLDTKSFSFTFSSSVNYSIVTGSIILSDGNTVSLTKEETSPGVLTFYVPEGSLTEGPCQFKLANVRENGKRGNYFWNYTLGIMDVSEENCPDKNSYAYIYKGGFLRLWAKAVYVYNNTAHLKGAKLSFRTNMKKAMDKYEGLVSTSPTVYQAAIDELTPLVARVEPYVDEAAAINDVTTAKPQQVEYFTAGGTRLSAPSKGLTIVKTTNSDNSVETRKLISK